MGAYHSKEPFLPTFGNKADPLIGREQIVAELVQGLERAPGYPTRASLITGQRGMGKTALLLEMAEQAEAMDFVVAQVAANESMNEDILQTIQKNGDRFVRDSRKRLAGISASALGFSLGLSFNEETQRNYGFRVKLELLCEKLEANEKGVLILVDEIQSSSANMRELAVTYQYLVGKGMNIAIIMAGLPHSISSVLNDDVLTFLNRAHKIELDPLPLTDIKHYYLDVCKEREKRLSNELANTLAQATHGYPYLFQLIGFNLIRNMEDKSVVTQKIVDTSIEDARTELVASVYLPVLKPLSNMDRAFLQAMALDDEASLVSDIIKRLHIDNSYAQKYRARLLNAGVVSSPRRGELAFTMPYLRDYLREHP